MDRCPASRAGPARDDDLAVPRRRGRARCGTAAAGEGPPAPPLVRRPDALPRRAGLRSAAARCSSETTSRSLVWEKSWYHSPIARKCAGVSRQITSSASAASAVHADGGATGTASTTRAAPCARATWQAARAVEPVAMPSSMMTAVRPASGVRGRSPRKRRARRSSSARSRRSTAAISASVTCAMATTSGLMILTSPSPIAPMPSSGWTGTPSLRTTITSSGAPSARATSAATGTPPRGSASTTTSSPRRCSIRLASRLPASDRSRNDMVIASVLSQSLLPSDGHDRGDGPRWLRARGDGRVQARPGSRTAGVQDSSERRKACVRVASSPLPYPPATKSVTPASARALIWAPTASSSPTIATSPGPAAPSRSSMAR